MLPHAVSFAERTWRIARSCSGKRHLRRFKELAVSSKTELERGARKFEVALEMRAPCASPFPLN